MERGKLIALEGIDGSGKSSQIAPLVERLTARGVRCRADREPTDRPAGALIRQALTRRVSMDNRVIAALFAADRLDHVTEPEGGLLAAVDRGITVVCDRYYFSSYAYHSVDVDMEWVIGANALAAELLRPTLTIFLDVPAEIAMERIRKNRDHEELFEKEERLRRTRELYFQAFDRLRGEEAVAVVDGTGMPDEVAGRVWAAAAPYFP